MNVGEVKRSVRLDKLLSNLGVASRSGCRDILRAGRVRVDGEGWKK